VHAFPRTSFALYREQVSPEGVRLTQKSVEAGWPPEALQIARRRAVGCFSCPWTIQAMNDVRL